MPARLPAAAALSRSWMGTDSSAGVGNCLLFHPVQHVELLLCGVLSDRIPLLLIVPGYGVYLILHRFRYGKDFVIHILQVGLAFLVRIRPHLLQHFFLLSVQRHLAIELPACLLRIRFCNGPVVFKHFLLYPVIRLFCLIILVFNQRDTSFNAVFGQLGIRFVDGILHIGHYLLEGLECFQPFLLDFIDAVICVSSSVASAWADVYVGDIRHKAFRRLHLFIDNAQLLIHIFECFFRRLEMVVVILPIFVRCNKWFCSETLRG